MTDLERDIAERWQGVVRLDATDCQNMRRKDTRREKSELPAKQDAGNIR